MGGTGSGRPRDEARRAEAARLRAEGLTLREIGRCLGITPQGAGYLLKPDKRPRSHGKTK